MSNSSRHITDYLVEKIVRHFTDSETPFDSPSSLFMALTSQGAELSGNGYGRAAIQFDEALSEDGVTEVRNGKPVQFSTASAEWNADGFAIYDEQSSGNRMYNGEFDEPITVPASGQLLIKKEHLRLSLGLDHWSTAAQERALNLAFAGGSYQPSGLYVALLTKVPQADKQELAELSDGGYSRAQVAPWNYMGPAAVSELKTSFPRATGDWAPVVATALLDALVGGVFLGWEELNSPLYVSNGDDLEIDPGRASFAV